MLELVAEVLEVGRQHKRLAEVLRVLVDVEARAEGRDLEEHAARLPEVDGAEPEAVDDRRGPQASARHALLPLLVVVHRRRPGDVVHARRRPIVPGSSGAGS